MKTYLLLDVSSLLHRAVHVHRALAWRGEPTGGLYGVMQQTAKLICDHEPDRVVACFDAPPYWRSRKSKAYKANRKRDDETARLLRHARSQVFRFFGVFGVSTWRVKGAEADDLLFRGARRCLTRGRRVLIASSDSDLYQAFALDGARERLEFIRRDGVYRESDFRRDYGIDPEDWWRVLVLAGTHNGLPGIRGVGVKTAIRIVISGRYEDALEEHPELRRTERLVRLPAPVGRGSRWRPPRLSMRALRTLCARYGIRTTEAVERAFAHMEDCLGGRADG